MLNAMSHSEALGAAQDPAGQHHSLDFFCGRARVLRPAAGGDGKMQPSICVYSVFARDAEDACAKLTAWCNAHGWKVALGVVYRSPQ